VAIGWLWLRSLTNTILDRNGLRGLATMGDRAFTELRRHAPPEGVSIRADELGAILRIIRSYLKHPEPADAEGQPPKDAKAHRPEPGGDQDEAPTPAVALVRSNNRPIVFDRHKPNLDPKLLQSISALIDVFPAGLDEAQLRSINTEAVEFLRALADSDVDWRDALLPPDVPGGAWRIAALSRRAQGVATDPPPSSAPPTPIVPAGYMACSQRRLCDAFDYGHDSGAPERAKRELKLSIICGMASSSTSFRTPRRIAGRWRPRAPSARSVGNRRKVSDIVGKCRKLYCALMRSREMV
jgi:hypothetical protein